MVYCEQLMKKEFRKKELVTSFDRVPTEKIDLPSIFEIHLYL